MNRTTGFSLVLALLIAYVYMNPISGGPGPSPSPSSSPTPTPSPTTGNLARIPEDFPLTYSWLSPPSIAFIDYKVVRTEGRPSLRLEKHVEGVDKNKNREIDGKWYQVEPGDHIVASCWIKIDPLPAGYTRYPHQGARIGIDLYAGSAIVTTYRWLHLGSDDRAWYVPFGTSGWVYRKMDFTVPSDFYTYDLLHKVNIPPAQIENMVLWFQVWSTEYGGTIPANAWFAEAELYINP